MERAVFFAVITWAAVVNSRFLLPGDISGNTDKSTHITELERQVALPVRTPAGLADDLVDCTLVEVRDLPVILYFLRNEPDIFLPVLRRVSSMLSAI